MTFPVKYICTPDIKSESNKKIKIGEVENLKEFEIIETFGAYE